MVVIVLYRAVFFKQHHLYESLPCHAAGCRNRHFESRSFHRHGHIRQGRKPRQKFSSLVNGKSDPARLSGKLMDFYYKYVLKLPNCSRDSYESLGGSVFLDVFFPGSVTPHLLVSFSAGTQAINNRKEQEPKQVHSSTSAELSSHHPQLLNVYLHTSG